MNDKDKLEIIIRIAKGRYWAFSFEIFQNEVTLWLFDKLLIEFKRGELWKTLLKKIKK